jgi:hypothetical protein
MVRQVSSGYSARMDTTDPVAPAAASPSAASAARRLLAVDLSAKSTIKHVSNAAYKALRWRSERAHPPRSYLSAGF